MKKVLILGSPGSGKSHFARRLSEKTAIPLFHLDLLWHKADKSTISASEFDSRISNIMAGNAWIMDGNYSRTLPARLAKCDSVFLFNIPAYICLEGALSRIGTKRPDLPWIEEETDEEFLQYIRSFPEEQLPMIRMLLEKAQVPIYEFLSRDQADAYVDQLEITTYQTHCISPH